MFDTFYPFKFIQSVSSDYYDFEKEHLYTFTPLHLYTFTGKGNHRYLIRVEEYPNDFYAVKFHLKAHSDSKDKYRLTTGYNDMPTCVSTCIQVMLEIAEKNPIASFGYIGANSLGEEKENTKRFRIYNRVMQNFFLPANYAHHFLVKESVYLLLRTANAENHAAIFEMAKRFLFDE